MAFNKSWEIRWFFEGKIPGEVKQWFVSGNNYQHQAIREDMYLRFPSSATVGTKIRNGNLEIKARVADHGIFKILKAAEGKIALWEKWSASDDLGLSSSSGIAPEEWLSVKKERLLKKYEFQTEVTEVDPEKELKDEGCQLELSTIYINEKLFWTLSFEAFGKKEAGIENLKKTVKTCFIKQNIPLKFLLESGEEASFALSHSYSYPSFLTAQFI